MTSISPRLRLEAAITIIGTVLLVILAVLYLVFTVVPPFNKYGHRNVVRDQNENPSTYAWEYHL